MDLRNTIVLGDCIQVMQQIPAGSVHFILTDPPYIVSYTDRSGRSITNDNNDAWLEPSFAEMYRVLAHDSFCVSFYGWHMADRFMAAFRAAGFRISGHLTFPKRYTSGSWYLRHQHENAFLLTKGRPKEPEYTIGDVIDWTYSGNKLHPTQKPLSVLTPLIETFSQSGNLVLDPFAGSASTLVAARSLGRNYLGIELDENYHALATDRLKAVQGCAAVCT
jgi:DNA modification methylase